MIWQILLWVLPVLNKGVVDDGIKAALALNMDIHKKMHFDHKNYFYPDNPKAYQIIENAGEADRIFSMLMGDKVLPRREFIEKNAVYANIDA